MVTLNFKELGKVKEVTDEGEVYIETFEPTEGWTKYRFYNEGEAHLIKQFGDKVVMLDNFSDTQFVVMDIAEFNDLTKEEGLLNYIRSMYEISEVLERSNMLFEEEQDEDGFYNLRKDVIGDYLGESYYDEINKVMIDYVF